MMQADESPEPQRGKTRPSWNPSLPATAPARIRTEIPVTTKAGSVAGDGSDHSEQGLGDLVPPSSPSQAEADRQSHDPNTTGDDTADTPLQGEPPPNEQHVDSSHPTDTLTGWQ